MYLCVIGWVRVCVFVLQAPNHSPCCRAPVATTQVYNTGKLTLVMVGPQLPRSVTALACKGDITFAAAGGVIHEAKRSHP
jgi:hypothetical protein